MCLCLPQLTHTQAHVQAHARAASRLRTASARSSQTAPPEGFVSVFVGKVRRWRRRWCAASSPGALTFSKRNHTATSALNLQVRDQLCCSAVGGVPVES